MKKPLLRDGFLRFPGQSFRDIKKAGNWRETCRPFVFAERERSTFKYSVTFWGYHFMDGW